MRIRRRASSSLPLSPDPSSASRNGSLGGEGREAGEREKLHPVGDRYRYDLGGSRCNGLPATCSSPCSDSGSHRRSDSSGSSSSSAQRGRGKDGISSGETMSGSSVAVEHGNGPGGGKAKGKARARAGAGPASASSSCTMVVHEETDKGLNLNGKKRQRRSPAVLMEGSRCSRVNGRGWRCCQQTLVGYSLCEHHLGKGRLRSMSASARGQLGTSKPRWSSVDAREGTILSRHQKEEEEFQEVKQRLQQSDDGPCNIVVADSNGADKIAEEEGDEAEMTSSKRKKIGVVKARTISSLLDYSDHSMLSHAQEVALLPSTNGIGDEDSLTQIMWTSMGFLCKFWCSWTPMILFSAAPWDCAILRHQIHELKSQGDDIARDVSRARRVGKEPRSQVLWWLDRVELLETKFAKTRREFERRFMLPGGVAVNILSSYRLSVRANEMIAEACYLKSKGSFNQVANRAAPNHFEEVPSAPTVGMDCVLAQLKQAVEDAAVGLIGIYGMGGVGKTALLSRFHNEFLADATDLDMVIFIDSCRDHDIESIQNKIQHRLGLSWKKRKSQKEKAAMLYKVLFKMKFVLILDDLWEPLSLQMVGIPIPKQGSSCKIMLATRIEELCDQMDVKNKIKVDLLPWDTARRLFADKVGEETINSNPGIRHQADILVKKCGGLPLALITVARALASKRSVDEWKHAVTIMGNSPVQLPGMAEQVFCSLKLSYDHLPSDTLRSCAMHFALYWEGCRLHKNLIQEYWIGEGILDDFKDMEQANNKACYFLGILSSASLIERVDADGYTRMHPMVRAMALWIACDFGKEENQWFVRERVGLMEAPEAETWRGAARMALGYNSITTLPEAPESLNLVSLKLKRNFGLERIPDGFFRFMPCLVALDLHSTSVKEIPSGISNLQRLQFLELGGTKLKSLPKELASLKNLRYLGLNWTAELASVPERLIQSLSELRVLRMIMSYSSWKAIPAGGGNGVSLRELEALKRLRVLDITVGNAQAFNMLAQSQRLAPSTTALLLKGCPGLTAVELPSGLGRSMKSLKWLRVSHSTELEEVAIADGGENDDAALPELENLVLEFLLKAKIVWRSSCIQHLRGLYIYGCSGMEQLIWYKDDDECDAENRGRRGVSPFPNLKQIAFRGLPKLKRVSDERQLVFPALESIEVVECPQLKKLNLVAEKLREIRCHRSWWDQLEWEDDAARSSSQIILKPFN